LRIAACLLVAESAVKPPRSLAAKSSAILPCGSGGSWLIRDAVVSGPSPPNRDGCWIFAVALSTSAWSLLILRSRLST
jgi:hypothetical protein